MVNIAKGGNQSLLGLWDAQVFGIVQVNKDGKVNTDVVNKLTESGVIDHMLERIVEQHTKLFQGVGRAKIEPIHIYMDSTVKPT